MLADDYGRKKAKVVCIDLGSVFCLIQQNGLENEI